MKFGGTSVEDATAIRRTAAIVLGRQKRGLQPLVIVSAMARVTDKLLAAANAAGAGDKAGALALSARLRSRHLETAGDLLKGPALSMLLGTVQQEFDALDESAFLLPAHRSLWLSALASGSPARWLPPRLRQRVCVARTWMPGFAL